MRTNLFTTYQRFQLRYSPLKANNSRLLRPRAMSASEASVDWDAYNSKWEKDWVEGVAPGEKWDQGKPSQALTQLLSSGTVVVQDKNVLVPGCGRGYDVVELASKGAARAVGLDISETGVKVAQEHWAAAGLPSDVSSRVHIVSGDFFSYQDEGGLFDLGYDYTFLCALHPDMRQKWAQAWAKHLKPGGELVTLIFPVDPAREGVTGPPWAVTPELYTGLLQGLFDCVSLEPVPPEQSHPTREGKEFLGRWRRV